MPIKDLENRYRPQRLGKVRLGIKKVNKKGVEYPSATDYFVLPEIPGLKEMYGEKPTTLDIIFFFDSVEQVFPHFHKWYSKRGLRCLGDGEIVWYRTDGEAENPIVSIRGAAIVDPSLDMAWTETYGPHEQVGNTVSCAGMNCPVSDGQRCRPTGRLCFGLIGVPMLGYLELTVHQRALLGIAGQLELAKAIFGHLTGIPFKLHLSPETIQVNGKAMKIHTPWLEIEHGWLATHLPKPEERKALAEAKAAADVEALYGPQEVEDLGYEVTSPEEIEKAKAEENGTEKVVKDKWTDLWAFAKENEIPGPDVQAMLEKTGGEPTEALKRLKKALKRLPSRSPRGKKEQPPIPEVSLETPAGAEEAIEEARARLQQTIDEAREEGVPDLKIVQVLEETIPTQAEAIPQETGATPVSEVEVITKGGNLLERLMEDANHNLKKRGYERRYEDANEIHRALDAAGIFGMLKPDSYLDYLMIVLNAKEAGR